MAAPAVSPRSPAEPRAAAAAPAGAARRKNGDRHHFFQRSVSVLKNGACPHFSCDDLAQDETLATNPGRVGRQAEIDAAVGEWTVQRPAEEVVSRLAAIAVPASTLYSVKDMVTDPHYQARQLFEEVAIGASGDRTVAMPVMLPRLSETPARTDWAGPELGQHTREALRERLALTDEAIDALAASGAIFAP